MDKHKKWVLNTYPSYWNRAAHKYGLDAYCQRLIDIISSYGPKNVFELAIGNGYPLADGLEGRSIAVAGLDISPLLIQELNKSNPNIHATAGLFEEYIVDEVKKYDIVYCLRSSWYFENFLNAVEFMIAMTKPEGYIIFDIMNADSVHNKSMIRKKNLSFPYTVIKNTIKTLLNMLSGSQKYMIDSIFGVREIMRSRNEIESFLNNSGFSYKALTLSDVLGQSGQWLQTSNDQKILYIVKNIKMHHDNIF